MTKETIQRVSKMSIDDRCWEITKLATKIAQARKARKEIPAEAKEAMDCMIAYNKSAHADPDFLVPLPAEYKI